MNKISLLAFQFIVLKTETQVFGDSLIESYGSMKFLSLESHQLIDVVTSYQSPNEIKYAKPEVEFHLCVHMNLVKVFICSGSITCINESKYYCRVSYGGMMSGYRSFFQIKNKKKFGMNK